MASPTAPPSAGELGQDMGLKSVNEPGPEAGTGLRTGNWEEMTLGVLAWPGPFPGILR
jgi:hypothetical protein